MHVEASVILKVMSDIIWDHIAFVAIQHHFGTHESQIFYVKLLVYVEVVYRTQQQYILCSFLPF